MRLALIAGLALGSALSLGAADDTPFKSPKEKASYALGMNMGKQLRQGDADIDTEIYMKALKEALSGGKLLLTDEQMREALMALSTEIRAKSAEKSKREGEKNKKEGEAFLAENKKKEGIITTASGLQYRVETKGTGKIPGSNDTVVCHYRGTLLNGDEFDSSYKRSEPMSFPVTGVIKGWTEALLMMPVGSKWKLYIPSDLAYGERGRPSIPANSTLLFDIELLSIKDPSEVGAAQKAPPIQPQIVPSGKPK
ncbi:MAG TPA: FKBP-type peptidyl-prolyl cis-trans isomerase [Candidatus Binatia bacterium]|nr:FKBP-type peptidyl-prolyl cis-trans isomerase [Candidatus Binatia bacterium]